MNRLDFVFTKKRMRKFLFLFWSSLLIIGWLLTIFICGATGDDGADSWLTIIFWFGGMMAILLFHVQLIVIYFYYEKYLKNKDTFFIFYFLFFIFYFLFFIFYFLNAIDIVYSIFPLMFLFFVFQIKNQKLTFILKRYGFAILVAIISLTMHLIKIYFIKVDIQSGNYSQNTIELYNSFFQTPRDFYWNEIYLLTFAFFIIQLTIEAYCFYKKEKPKWQRYERMQRYKKNKIK